VKPALPIRGFHPPYACTQKETPHCGVSFYCG
jgi:hypothetical protein